MGYLEAREAIVYGKLIENFRIPHVADEYYDLIVIPGFSDGHAHPQVVDAGIEANTRWRNSYEWFETRRLNVDEAAVRADLNLSTLLAELTFKRALLEGTTLIAVTGRLEANLSAWLSLAEKPRVVFLPTVMSKRGWASVDDISPIAERYSKYLDDGLARIGVFVHSIRYGREMIRKALALASRLGSVMGIHVSEGLKEMEELAKAAGGPPYPARIVGVHCTEGDEDPAAYGITCISCPYSNLILYGRTRPIIKGIAGFGSDWPLLIGSIGSHMKILTSSGWDIREVLKKATLGSYRAYSVRIQGDLVALDGSLKSLLEGNAKVKLVMVGNRIMVKNGSIPSTGETINDIIRSIDDAIRLARDKYGLDHKPVPGTSRFRTSSGQLLPPS